MNLVTERGGYLLIVRDQERQERIGALIAQETYFTDTVTADKWHGQTREIALISLDGQSIDCLCLVERQQRVATYQVRLRFSNFIVLEGPISFELIQSNIDGRVLRFFDRAISSAGGGWVTPVTWNEVIQVISSLQPQIVSQLEGLYERFINRRIYDNPVFDVLAQEKDAYASIIRYAGFESVAGSSVTSWSVNGNGIDSPVSSFVASIQPDESITILEDQAIEFDSTQFGDWQQIRQFVTGERIFRKGDDSLYIRNVNRQPLEETLGVDLIFYNYSYHAFVLVQYKRMKRENSNDYRYRPDAQFQIEIERMRAFETENPSLLRQPTSLSEYRLNNGAFYFKFHDSEIFDPVNASRIKGMHVPLDYWGLFEASPQARGPLGGLYVGYDNMGRYLNNTDFEAVVSSGLVGSSGTITDVLLKIVEPLVLELNHSVTVGIKV